MMTGIEREISDLVLSAKVDADGMVVPKDARHQLHQLLEDARVLLIKEGRVDPTRENVERRANEIVQAVLAASVTAGPERDHQDEITKVHVWNPFAAEVVGRAFTVITTKPGIPGVGIPLRERRLGELSLSSLDVLYGVREEIARLAAYTQAGPGGTLLPDAYYDPFLEKARQALFREREGDADPTLEDLRLKAFEIVCTELAASITSETDRHPQREIQRMYERSEVGALAAAVLGRAFLQVNNGVGLRLEDPMPMPGDSQGEPVRQPGSAAQRLVDEARHKLGAMDIAAAGEPDLGFKTK
jgi:hypothetical protein